MKNKEMSLSECMVLMRKEYEKKNGIITSDEEALEIAKKEIRAYREEKLAKEKENNYEI